MNTYAHVSKQSSELSSSLLSAIALVLGGALIVFTVGFANIPAVHNATHDTRHAIGFPCH